jgi:hypothetical protein
MSGTKQYLLDVVEIDLGQPNDLITVYVNVYNNSLSKKWLSSLNILLEGNYHIEKNYCFLGFADGPRNGQYLLDQINLSIAAINNSRLGYHISDYFDMSNSVDASGGVNHAHFNQLHRYFEDLQGGSGHISDYYWRADHETRWHIRQLNLLCHEFESWQLSWRKKHTAPDWQRPSQLMCWLNAPRFVLDESDYEFFGIDTLNRELGGVYIGVNKAVGKHHWEVFQDEGRDSRITELTTTSLKSQTEASGDFDIEWANDPGSYHWQIKKISDFRSWLLDNGFDPEDKSLTIGHPQIGQIDLVRSFGTKDFKAIWQQLNTHLNVLAVRTSDTSAMYEYSWSDTDYMQQQIRNLK